MLYNKIQMPALTIPQVIAAFFNYNAANAAPPNGKTSKNTMSYYMGIMWSYNLEICHYNHITNVFTIHDHTAKGMGMRTPTTSNHIMKLKRFLEQNGANINMVNYIQQDVMRHNHKLLINTLPELKKTLFLKELNRIQKEHYIFDDVIFKHVFLPFLQ